MRSYYAHLQSTQSKEASPIYRASAIFPVFQKEHIFSRLLFMGYWILKRNITELTCTVTLRDEKGKELNRTTHTITEPKTYRIELAALTKAKEFVGSLEIEFFSKVPLVFPFPAVSINYYGPHFSTVVHTAQRTYNDTEDREENSQIQVPESGFNIHANEDTEPFVTLINGAQPVEDERMQIEFYNAFGDTMTHEMRIGELKPYETRLLYPAKEVPLQPFLQGKVGAAKLKFQVNGIFPRLLVGNVQKSLPALSVTHTYYDCTFATSDKDYWLPNQNAALMLPCRIDASHETVLYFYPIYSPGTLEFSLEIYDKQGACLGKKENILRITSPSLDFKSLSLNSLWPDLAPQKELAVRILAHPLGSNRIPARIKIAFDISRGGLPCNICTNLQPYNPDWEKKPKTFRWLPLLADQKGASVWIMNSGPLAPAEAKLDLTFYREKDSETLQRTHTLPPHAFLVLCTENDPELNTFLEGTIGWVTVQSSNAYTTTYYFVEHPSGPVGGDHGY